MKKKYRFMWGWLAVQTPLLFVLPLASCSLTNTGQTIAALETEKQRLDEFALKTYMELSQAELNELDANPDKVLSWFNFELDPKFSYKVEEFASSNGLISFQIKISANGYSRCSKIYEVKYKIVNYELNAEKDRVEGLSLPEIKLTQAEFDNINKNSAKLIEAITGKNPNFKYTAENIVVNGNKINFLVKISFGNIDVLTQKELSVAYRIFPTNEIISEQNRINNLKFEPLNITQEQLDQIAQNTNSLLELVTDKKPEFDYMIEGFNNDTGTKTLTFKVKISQGSDSVWSNQLSVQYTIVSSSQHTLSLLQMQNASSPLEIIKQTPLFKTKLKLLNEALNANKFDFMVNVSDEKINEFYSLITEIGYYGDFGSGYDEKMKYAPGDWLPGNYMTQKYLENFTDSSGAIAKTPVDLNALMSQNQFGYLPSNLSQFLYYLDLKEIGNFFGIPNVTKIQMNFDDEAGTADILITNSNNQKYLLNYTTTLPQSNKLHKNHDFRQYIFDRSFRIILPRQVRTVVNNVSGAPKEIKLTKQSISGSAWVIDRIVNPNNTGSNTYDFLIGTNIHVLDFSYGFNKSRTSATHSSAWTFNEIPAKDGSAKTYNDKWDGGLWNLGGINGVGQDEIETIPQANPYWQYEKFKANKRSPEKVQPVKLYRPSTINGQQITDPDQITPSSTYTEVDVPIINPDQVIDAIWYTPEISTSGIWTWNDKRRVGPIFDIDKTMAGYDPNNISTGYKTWNGRWVGKTSNGGSDFAITKISLNREQVKTILPTLEPLLDTPEEKSWYVGLGVNNLPVEISANSSLFVGGYPEGSWKSIKVNRGRINAQQRFINTDEANLTVQKYWTRYDEVKNQKFNDYRGLTDWYKKRFESPSMTPEQNNKYMPHGMEIQKILQQSFIYVAGENGTQDEAVVGGASGSICINSRFELVGALFGLIFTGTQAHPDKYCNVITLMKNYTEENKNLNIVQEVIDKLKTENLKALKMMSA